MLDDLLAELTRPLTTLNLFPTENRLSPKAQEVLGSHLVSRYPGSSGDGFLYGDPSGLDRLYAECERLCREYFEARHAFVPFLSGLHAMQSVLTTVCRAGDRVLVMDPGRGGHYATETICRDLGLEVDYVPFDGDTLLIDTERLARLASARRPHFVYLDLSTSLRQPRPAEIRAAVGPEPVLCLDASHLLGLLPGCLDLAELWRSVDLVSASTHKTFPGPQKAVVLTGSDRMAERVAGRVPFRVSNAHSNSVAALAVTLAELLPSRAAYARAVTGNAGALAEALSDRGFEVVGKSFGHTETHQVWVLPPAGQDALGWGRRLIAAGVRATVVNLPSHQLPGLRLGVQELTRMGMDRTAMVVVADLLTAAVRGTATPESTRAAVAELVAGFPTVHTTF
jgi:glycine hydroxymethyltransferase